MEGEDAAIVTTNFDDCLERALDMLGARSYKLKGIAYGDGKAIIDQLNQCPRGTTLVIVINGPEAYGSLCP